MENECKACKFLEEPANNRECANCRNSNNWEPLIIPDSGLTDSGKRVVHPGGGMREPKEEYFHLIPMSGLMELARHYRAGGKKYGDRNWESGAPWSESVDAIFRHIIKFNAHGNVDENHLAAIAWNAFTLMEYMETHPEFNNLGWEGKK